jgi:hypothetical protein
MTENGLNLCCQVNPYTQCFLCSVALCEGCFKKKKYYDSKCYGFLKVMGIEGEHRWGDAEET